MTNHNELMIDDIILPLRADDLAGMVDCMAAAQFWDAFHGFSRWWLSWGNEVCEVSWSTLQGLEAHVELYRNSPLMYEFWQHQE